MRSLRDRWIMMQIKSEKGIKNPLRDGWLFLFYEGH